mmetsp:Transcript_48209/g.66974  ORF Transcript_48209/g.66974 Transcript_48209/m.66974 type:complete len:216 (-) Transcript_48209:68-715(-)
MRDTRKVVEAAAKQKPRALRFASEKLKSDEDLVKQVATVDGTILEFAVDLCGNRRVAVKAVEQSWEALRFEEVAGGLPANLLLEAVKQDWRAVQEVLKKEPEVSEDLLLQMATTNPEIVRASQLRGHRMVARAALEVNGMMLHYLLPHLRSDLELAAAAVRQNPDALSEAHPALRQEPTLRSLQKEGFARRAHTELRRAKALKEAEELDCSSDCQ